MRVWALWLLWLGAALALVAPMAQACPAGLDRDGFGWADAGRAGPGRADAGQSDAGVLGSVQSAVLPSAALDLHAQAVEAYRSGDWDTARTLWLAALDGAAESGAASGLQLSGELARASLCHNLGNASYRLGDQLQAVAWYSAALDLDPRSRETRANLELARRGAGLEPADRGDLDATFSAVCRSLNRIEAQWLALAVLLLAALALCYEAFRGGPAGRRLVGVALVLLVLGLLPWLYWLAAAGRDPFMIVSAGGSELFAEPRDSASVTGEIEAAATVERIDSWPGWIKVELPSGKQGWVPQAETQSLRP